MNYGKGWRDPTKYGVPEGWKFVGPDRESKHYFYLRCKECGAEKSFAKYQLGKVHSCWAAGSLTAFCVAHAYGQGSPL